MRWNGKIKRLIPKPQTIHNIIFNRIKVNVFVKQTEYQFILQNAVFFLALNSLF